MHMNDFQASFVKERSWNWILLHVDLPNLVLSLSALFGKSLLDTQWSVIEGPKFGNCRPLRIRRHVKKLKRRWKKGKKIWLLMGNSFNKVFVGVFRGHSGNAEPVTVSKNTTMFDIFLYHEDERTSSRPVAASTTSFPLGRGHLFRRKNVRNQQRLLLRYACTANNCSVIS